MARSRLAACCHGCRNGSLPRVLRARRSPRRYSAWTFRKLLHPDIYRAWRLVAEQPGTSPRPPSRAACYQQAGFGWLDGSCEMLSVGFRSPFWYTHTDVARPVGQAVKSFGP